MRQATRKRVEVKTRYRPIVVGAITLAAFDSSGIITMIVAPNLTPRVIPALAGIQIFGFVVIAFVSIIRSQMQKREY